jgi:hypothetical protein
MNKSTIATILGTALGLLKSSGSRNDRLVIRHVDQLIEYAGDDIMEKILKYIKPPSSSQIRKF